MRKRLWLSGWCLLPWAGCVRLAARHAPLTPPPIERPAPPHDLLLEHLLGSWNAVEKQLGKSAIVFEANGQVAFEGSAATFNPGSWRLDRDRHELTITLPDARDDQLDIFHLNLGDGVKAFHRAQKQVVYDMTEETSTLNFAGWFYEKPQAAEPLAPQDEPVLK